ncbi:MAG: hypothetical protein WD509_00295 [Candidatus Paceibacterota bacterium]
MSDDNNLFLLPLDRLTPDILWYVFAGAVLVFFIYSIFLVYHWFRYGMNVLTSLLATIIYLGVSGIILIITIISFASLLP